MGLAQNKHRFEEPKVYCKLMMRRRPSAGVAIKSKTPSFMTPSFHLYPMMTVDDCLLFDRISFVMHSGFAKLNHTSILTKAHYQPAQLDHHLYLFPEIIHSAFPNSQSHTAKRIA